MKIFCVGLSRTGTHSLSTALERLGYTSKHFPDPFHIMEEAEKYDSLTDTPVIPYMYELDKKYPDAKFILTTRNEDDWITSVGLHFKLVKPGSKKVKHVRMNVYGRLTFNEKAFRKVFRENRKRTLALFKDRPDKLLIMNIRAGHGYERLCPFLGHEIINEPFPCESVRRPV